MEAVLDTNVVVSAAISPKGPPADIIRAWRAGAFVWISSEALLDELRRTLAAPRLQRYIAWSGEALEEFFVTVDKDVKLVLPRRKLAVIKSDPSDNRILEAAKQGRADYIVSGDSDLLDLAAFEDTPIVTPARFLAILSST